jgi:hypothetical protein
MASLVPGRPVPPQIGGQILLQQFHKTQQAIGQRASRAITGLWDQHIVPVSFMDSWERIYPLVNAVTSSHYDMSAANAAQYYLHSRALTNSAPIPVPSAEPDSAYIKNVNGMMGPGQFFHYLKEAEPDQASVMARDSLSGATSRIALNGGRDTITAVASSDPVAQGWERVIEPGACSFCAMLAGRGSVYKAGSVNFRAHDHCHCVARPVFAGDKPINADLGDEWAIATKGKRGAAARAAWDEYWKAKNVESITGPAQESAVTRSRNAAIGQQRE